MKFFGHVVLCVILVRAKFQNDLPSPIGDINALNITIFMCITIVHGYIFNGYSMACILH